MSNEEEIVLKLSSMNLYAGGSDTVREARFSIITLQMLNRFQSVSTLHCFFLAMVLFPEVQKKAQEELDRVVGPDRLPAFADRPSLPYIDAIVKESNRWHSVTPMGVPHIAAEDDVYNGMFIPKGTMLMANIWLFMHDEANHKDPMAFKPERFLGENPEIDPFKLAFGFGRRVCPGRELADASVFLSIAMSLWALDIRKARDEKGNVIEPKVYFTAGKVSYLDPFKCDIRPRSVKHDQLIRTVEDEHPMPDGDAALLEGLKWKKSAF